MRPLPGSTCRPPPRGRGDHAFLPSLGSAAGLGKAVPGTPSRAALDDLLRVNGSPIMSPGSSRERDTQGTPAPRLQEPVGLIPFAGGPRMSPSRERGPELGRVHNTSSEPTGRQGESPGASLVTWASCPRPPLHPASFGSSQAILPPGCPGAPLGGWWRGRAMLSGDRPPKRCTHPCPRARGPDRLLG